MEITGRTLEYTAKEEDGGRTVRDVLINEFHLVNHDISRAKYRDGGITLDGEHVWVNRTMKPGQLLRILIEDEASGKIIPVRGELDIVYEDTDVICLNKPAGIVVHPSHGHYADSLGNILAWYYQSKNEAHEIRSIGRLDKDTSGLILFGKNRTAVSKLNEQAEKSERSRIYLALAAGIFDNQSGCVDAPIARAEEGKMKREVCADGDSAVTFYEVVRQYESFALLRVKLKTGRTHQIRVHMAYTGHPLLGDSLYGNGAYAGLERAALHSSEIEFRQPFSGQAVRLEAQLPEDMRALIK